MEKETCLNNKKFYFRAKQIPHCLTYVKNGVFVIFLNKTILSLIKIPVYRCYIKYKSVFMIDNYIFFIFLMEGFITFI